MIDKNATIALARELSVLGQLWEGNSDLVSLANHERLCKLRENYYVICQDYCCGEFWESSPPFCCPNNFKPIRNLFIFLLCSFVALFITMTLFLVLENIVKCDVMEKIGMLEELYHTPSFSEMQTINRELRSSDDVSPDDSVDDDEAPRRSFRPTKQILRKHSQSFKDMSRLKTNKRMKKNKNPK